MWKGLVTKMTAGYLRLSRDEDKKQYVSIENQRLILNQYAESNGLTINIFYEDDNVSGYTFNRPGMKRMMQDVESGLIDTVIAKDLSRIGRHNAKVLLFVEDCKDREIRLILVNDNYDSFLSEDDDVLGIKTWYNERYVKDTSRKMKKVLRARQKEGTLAVKAPFGYEVSKTDKYKVEMIDKEAAIIRSIFDSYLHGNGYRNIAGLLNEKEIPTPSALMKERTCNSYNGKTAKEWSSEMVRDILKNDYYIGTLRLHVRERKSIHGTDLRVPKQEQFLFREHHESLIAPDVFEAVQQTMADRIRSRYRGKQVNISVFGNCMFCKDCGQRMNYIRCNNKNNSACFVCRTYHAKGKRYCSSHMVKEAELQMAVKRYLLLCKDILREKVRDDFEKQEKSDQLVTENATDSANEKQQCLLKELDYLLYRQTRKLDYIIEEKINHMTQSMEDGRILEDTYHRAEKIVLTEINRLHDQIKETKKDIMESKNRKNRELCLLAELEEAAVEKELSARHVKLLIERIEADRDGLLEIKLCYEPASFIDEARVRRSWSYKKDMLQDALSVVREEKEIRGYTSARNMSKKLNEMGFKTSKRSVLPILQNLIERNILIRSENPRQPYIISGETDFVKTS